MRKRKHEGLETENESKVKKLKTQKEDNPEFVSTKNPVDAVAIQSKSNEQAISAVNGEADGKTSDRVTKKRKRSRKSHAPQNLSRESQHEDNPELVSTHDAVAIQPKSIEQPISAVDGEANGESSNRVAKKRKRPRKSSHAAQELSRESQHEDNPELVSTHDAVAIQPKSNEQPISAVNGEAKGESSDRVAKKRKRPRKSHAAQELSRESQHEDNPELVSTDDAVAIQPKSNEQPISAVNGEANGESSNRVAKKGKRSRKPHAAQELGRESQHESKKTKKHEKKVDTAPWKVSEFTGGRMLNLDPIFALNEEYLLLAFDTVINVYATSTSLLIRRLQSSKSDRISAFAFDSTNTSHLFVSTSSGSIEKWDWLEGTRLEYWDISATIFSLATSLQVNTEENNGLIYTVDRKGGGQWRLTVHRLLGGSDASKTDLGTLLRYREPLTSVKILGNGRIVVVTSGSRLIIGTCDRPNPDSLKDIFYVWRDVDCPEWITSIDVQLRPHDTTIKKSKRSKDAFQDAVDIAVGTLRGRIIIYDDLLENLKQIERGAKNRQMDGVSSRRLHWHRSAVLALKWSLDGNYIISGGSETVLVIWQLETGQKQVLPHLSAPIEGIVVSPSGSSYGVRLADNSAMILSTSELQPTFSVAGVQLPVTRNAETSLPFIPNVDVPSAGPKPKENLDLPALVSPSDPGRLLLAVPSFTTSGLNPTVPNSSCYLQTFNVNSGHQIAKQALTRTKDTMLRTGPKQNLIQDPDVIHMKISHDARWLATVDEWLPPNGDVAFLAFNKEREEEERSYRCETHLKIWLWHDQEGIWQLSSRIDNPHSSQFSMNRDSRAILALASNPSCASFATVGANNELRVWKPSIRRRNGREVRGKDGRPLMNWHCCHVTLLEDSNIVSRKTQREAKLAYSPDGSVLAAGYLLPRPPTIYLIDSSTGTLQRTVTCMFTGPLLGLEIIDKYLIVLSHELSVWDLVTEELSFGFKIPRCGLDLKELITATRLAADAKDGTFAVSLPEEVKSSRNTTKLRSRLLIFAPTSPTPLFDTSSLNTTLALLSATGRKAYYIIDSAAEIRVVTSNQSMIIPSQATIVDEDNSPRGLENIYGDRIGGEADAGDNVADEVAPQMDFASGHVLLTTEKDDTAVVSQDQLAEIFDTGSAFTLPTTAEMFEQVARLYLGKQS